MLGTHIIHILVVILSCCVVVYKPSNGFEFFRNLVILGASLGYDFWSTYLNRVITIGKSSWREKVNLVGVVFSVALCLLGLFGLCDAFELDMENFPHSVKTTQSVLFDVTIIELETLLLSILVIPVALVVADGVLKPSQVQVSERRRKK